MLVVGGFQDLHLRRVAILEERSPRDLQGLDRPVEGFPRVNFSDDERACLVRRHFHLSAVPPCWSSDRPRSEEWSEEKEEEEEKEKDEVEEAHLQQL